MLWLFSENGASGVVIWEQNDEFSCEQQSLMEIARHTPEHRVSLLILCIDRLVLLSWAAWCGIWVMYMCE